MCDICTINHLRVYFYKCMICGRYTTLPVGRSTWDKTVEILCTECNTWYDAATYDIATHPYFSLSRPLF